MNVGRGCRGLPGPPHSVFDVGDGAVVQHDVARDVQGHQVDQPLQEGERGLHRQALRRLDVLQLVLWEEAGGRDELTGVMGSSQSLVHISIVQIGHFPFVHVLLCVLYWLLIRTERRCCMLLLFLCEHCKGKFLSFLLGSITFFP